MSGATAAAETVAVDLLRDQLGAHVVRTIERPVDSTSAHATALDRAASPGYGRWLEHVASVRGCERPIRLVGHLHTINPATGEILSSRPTAALPDGVLYVPCGDRRASVCPACAETYRADTYHLIHTGLVGGKGVPDSVATHPVVFATFTAPAFGAVHSRVVDPRTGKVKPCRMRRSVQRCQHGRILSCAQRHTEGAACLGQPLCPECYDYDHHVVWNSWAPELWRRTLITAHRQLRSLERAHGVRLRLSYAKVAEYQNRGLIHFHALIRIDAIDPMDPDAVLAPPAGITATDLDDIITTAAVATGFITPPHPQNPDGWPITWGHQLDIRPVSFTGELTDTAVAGYLAKYATKSTEATGHLSARITTENIDYYRSLTTHPARLIVASWNLGYRPDDKHPNEWKSTYGRLRHWAHMLGYGGHHTTKSRRYSTTRTALKAARSQWRRAHHYARRAQYYTSDHSEEDTTLVVGVLTFAGIGYRTTGDQWLAITAAAQARDRRYIGKREQLTAVA
jgi:hypothetical protein